MKKKTIGLLVTTMMIAALPGTSTSAGEVLYNGIELPAEWPPKPASWARQKPVTPPYLNSPPKVIPIDVGRQLFVDDFLIQKTDLKRTYHQPKYHEGNPVLKPEKAWETVKNFTSAAPFSGGVWWDPKDNMFKMWYSTSRYTAYATSPDGIQWNRPVISGSPVTGSNITTGFQVFRDSATTWLDLEARDPAKRYISMTWRARYFQTRFSADGMHWGEVVAKHGCGDRSTFFYNPFRKVWVYSFRAGRGVAGGRCRYYLETRDLTKSTTHVGNERSIWACADGLDKPLPGYDLPTQLYNLDAAPYESLMIGFFSIWHGDCRDDELKAKPKGAKDFKAGRPKVNITKIAYSRDGFYWDRPDRRGFLDVNDKPGAWNYGNVQSAGGGCIVMGDRLYFYCSGRAGGSVEGSAGHNWGISTGLAFLRRDGFASMDGSGTLTTRPVTFKGKHLFVNVDNPKGELRVEVLSERGKAISAFTKANCTPVKANKTLQAVTWKDGDLSTLAGKKVRFRFHLTNGKLYSFWVSPDKNGASHGYVAAGGPGFTSNKDTVGDAAYKAAETTKKP